MAARLELHEAFEGEGMKVAPPRVVFFRLREGAGAVTSLLRPAAPGCGKF